MVPSVIFILFTLLAASHGSKIPEQPQSSPASDTPENPSVTVQPAKSILETTTAHTRDEASPTVNPAADQYDHDHPVLDQSSKDRLSHDHSSHNHSNHNHSNDDHSSHDHFNHEHSSHDHSKHDHSSHDHSSQDHSSHDDSSHDHSEHDHSGDDIPVYKSTVQDQIVYTVHPYKPNRHDNSKHGHSSYDPSSHDPSTHAQPVYKPTEETFAVKEDEKDLKPSEQKQFISEVNFNGKVKAQQPPTDLPLLSHHVKTGEKSNFGSIKVKRTKRNLWKRRLE